MALSDDRQRLHRHPPGGHAWTFASSPTSLTVTTPAGGSVQYTFETELFRKWKEEGPIEQIVVRTRSVTDPQGPSGTWTFAYNRPSGYGGPVISTVSWLNGSTPRAIEYRHTARQAGQWLLAERLRYHNGGEVSRAVIQYEDRHFGTLGPVPNDLQSIVNQVQILEGGKTYTTTYEYHGDDAANHWSDYLRPWRIVETGDLTRTTTREFDYDFAAGLGTLHRVKSQTVAVGGESFTSSAEHDDATGFRTSQTQFGIATLFGADAAGDAGSVTDAVGHQDTQSYQWGVPTTVTTPQGTTVRTAHPDGTIASESRGGATTSFAYDLLGRVRYTYPPEGATIETSYADDGSWMRVTRGSSWTQTSFDGFGRVIGTENTEGVKTVRSYDIEGRTTYESSPFTGGAHVGEALQYDALGRISRVTHPDETYVEHTELADPLGSRVYIRDENGRFTQQIWQAFGDPTDRRLYLVKDADDKWWRYTYNGLGSLTRVEGPEGPDRVWVYNSSNQLVSETHPESGTTTSTYYPDGLLHTKTVAAGTSEAATTSYGYDGEHRLTSIDAPGTADDTWIGYDGRGNRDLLILGNGNQTTFTHDGANRLTGREERVNGQIFSTTFAYDTRDNLKTITYPSNRTVQYDYDSADRVTRVYSGSQTYAQQVGYHASGAVTAMTLGNGAQASLTLDNRHRPDHLVSGPLDVDYDYDGVGNVSSILDARAGFSAWYTYDALDRLRIVTGFGANEFTYNARGDRVTKATPGVTYAYDPATNRLLSATSAPGPDQGTFQYDVVGHMKSDGVGGTYTYSPRNTLTSATINGATTTYTYDADGLRIQKSSATGQQYYVRGLGGQLLAEYAALFAKSAPASGTMSTNTSQTLQWTPVIGATAYAYCLHTVNNNCSGVSWTGTGSSTSATLTNLAPGTYYWQAFALTASGWKEADNNTWWSFTIYTTLFGKQGPPSGQSGLGSSLWLQWGSVPDSGYWVCWDTTNNNSCDAMWWPNGAATTKLLENLTPATYYWQVKADTPTGQWDADGGIWWSFTVGAGGGPSKLAPAPDLSNLSSSVLTQWTAIPDDGYWICWDQTNNNLCDTMWWPNGGATAKWIENLAAGTYYWQVKSATTGAEFNGDAWWAFTVGTPVTSFNKLTPGNGGILTANNAPLTWTTAPGASFYETCVDQVNNNSCDTSWENAALATARTLTGLTDGTYYWQVRATTASGNALADSGTWWSITIDAPDPIREYIYLGGQLLASLTLTTATPVLTYYHTDVLGSVRAITDTAGALVGQRIDYFPFGESTAPLTGDPRRFTGKELDPETAFHYFDARYQRNVLGRFTSVDPLIAVPTAAQDPQQWNRYAFARNNPLRFSDPTGLYVFDPNATPAQRRWFNNQIRDAESDCRAAGGTGAPCDVLGSYGKEGEDNGVTIAFGPLSKNTPAESESSGLSEDRTKVLLRVTFDWNQRSGDPVLDVFHEGSHLTSYQAAYRELMAAMRCCGGDPAKVSAAMQAVAWTAVNITKRESETLAYGVSASSAILRRHRNLEYAGFQIMQNGMINKAVIARLVNATTKDPDRRIFPR